MKDGDKLNPEIVKAMLAEIAGIFTGPSLKEMRADPELAKLLKDSRETNPIISKIVSVLQDTPKIACLAPIIPSCTNSPIKSHSIQKGGSLRNIADSSNRVMMFQMELSFDERPKAIAREVGINKATTFPGLCNQHDTEIFEKIERDKLTDPTDEQLFLFSYRSFLREYYAKHCQAKQAESMAQMFAHDPMISPYVQVLLPILAHGPYVGSVHMESVRQSYEALYRIKAFSERQHASSLKYILRKVDEPVAFAVASYFTPAFDFDGNNIPYGGANKLMPFMTIDVVPNRDGSFISIAYTSKFEVALGSLVRKLIEAPTTQVFLRYIWELTLRNCENLVIAPEAWNLLQPNTRADIEEFFTSTIRHRWQPWPDLSIPAFN